METSPAVRLAELHASPDCVCYCTSAPLSGRKERQVSLYANCRTGETFVIVTDGETSRVRSFVSRHRGCPPEARRQGMPLVDMADAFALARKMCSSWPRQPGPRGTRRDRSRPHGL